MTGITTMTEQDIRIEFLSRINRLAPIMPQYEAVLEAMYRRILQPGQTVYDIGCHAGRHARPLSRTGRCGWPGHRF